MSKESNKYRLWIGLGFILAATTLIVVAIVNVMNGKTAGDMTISGEAKVNSITCRDDALRHPAFASKPAISYANTITASFRDNKLSSISLFSEGSYETEQMAEEAAAFAAADYNLTLVRKYGEKSDVFSNSFTVDGKKLQLVQTTRDISKINSNTIVYFLLDQGTNIARSLDELTKQYEAKGFSCEKSD